MNNDKGANVQHFIECQQKKQKEYTVKFTSDQGGSVADDMEF